MRAARGLIAIGISLAACASCAVARAQSAGEWASSTQLWHDTCRYCHNGKLAAELRGAGLSAQAIVSAVRSGPHAMPSFAPSQISDQDLEKLAEWVRTQPKPAPAQVDQPDRTSRHGTRQRLR